MHKPTPRQPGRIDQTGIPGIDAALRQLEQLGYDVWNDPDQFAHVILVHANGDHIHNLTYLDVVRLAASLSGDTRHA